MTDGSRKLQGSYDSCSSPSPHVHRVMCPPGIWPPWWRVPRREASVRGKGQGWRGATMERAGHRQGQWRQLQVEHGARRPPPELASAAGAHSQLIFQFLGLGCTQPCSAATPTPIVSSTLGLRAHPSHRTSRLASVGYLPCGEEPRSPEPTDRGCACLSPRGKKGAAQQCPWTSPWSPAAERGQQ